MEFVFKHNPNEALLNWAFRQVAMKWGRADDAAHNRAVRVAQWAIDDHLTRLPALKNALSVHDYGLVCAFYEHGYPHPEHWAHYSLTDADQLGCEWSAVHGFAGVASYTIANAKRQGGAIRTLEIGRIAVNDNPSFQEYELEIGRGLMDELKSIAISDGLDLFWPYVDLHEFLAEYGFQPNAYGQGMIWTAAMP